MLGGTRPGRFQPFTLLMPKFEYSDYFALFGAVSLVLGILGWVRARSVPSVVAGGIAGIGLVASAMVCARWGTPGYIMGLALSALLLGRFLPVYLKTKQIYPAGLMALFSVLGVIAGVLGLVNP